MLKSTILLSFGLSALAQSVTQTIFFIGPSISYDAVASVMGVANGLTTYAVACSSGQSLCSTGITETWALGPSTLSREFSTVTGGVTIDLTEFCRIASPTAATCTATGIGNVGDISTQTVVTTTLGPSEFHYHPVTITAGAEKLTATGTSGNNAVSTGTSRNTAVSTGTSGNNAMPQATGMGVAAMGVLGVVALL